ncbi:MAG: hypothetical protein J7539_09460 [Niabella sp.]|nr:hypothetical protein [Niabella sp.]
MIQLAVIINNRTVLAKVNKTDMNNPEYGTKEKPILVFSARGADHPLEDMVATDEKPEGFMMNIDTPVDQYRYNVFMYFTYIMPKKEFKERFDSK